MIDFHSHILPNIDDGAKNTEESINLLKEAKKVGFESIILTPHYIIDYYENKKSDNQKLLNILSEKLNEEKIDLNLYLANEIYFDEKALDLLENGSISTINNTKYILMELPLNTKPLNINEVIFNYRRKGYVVILAHPERYIYINDLNFFYKLAEEGVLFQINYLSILGFYGRKAKDICIKLLKSNVVYFLGSDVHKQNTIYKNIPSALKKIEKIIGKEKTYELTTKNPNAVLNNDNIKLNEVKRIKIGLWGSL